MKSLETPLPSKIVKRLHQEHWRFPLRTKEDQSPALGTDWRGAPFRKQYYLVKLLD
ncbi:MAG: hypothetical protein VX413_02625 [Verrucomicrobiota bacterium]|nr:hypothetical protein [Verrucomicrobiota bacterium]